MTSQLTEIALQMLGTIERMELIIPEITDTIRKALEEKAALAEPVPPVDEEVAQLVADLRSVANALSDEGFVGSVDRCRRAADLLERLAPQPVPSGCWDETRWHPTTTRLVPPAALVEVERWLRTAGEAV